LADPNDRLRIQRTGGDYTTSKGEKKPEQKRSDKRTNEEWQTKEGSGTAKQDDGTQKRYLPKKAWEELDEGEKKATEEKKMEGSKAGKQFVANTREAKRKRGKVSREGEKKGSRKGGKDKKAGEVNRKKKEEGGKTEQVQEEDEENEEEDEDMEGDEDYEQDGEDVDGEIEEERGEKNNGSEDEDEEQDQQADEKETETETPEGEQPEKKRPKQDHPEAGDWYTSIILNYKSYGRCKTALISPLLYESPSTSSSSGSSLFLWLSAQSHTH
jgi:hypothetical protein